MNSLIFPVWISNSGNSIRDNPHKQYPVIIFKECELVPKPKVWKPWQGLEPRSRLCLFKWACRQDLILWFHLGTKHQKLGAQQEQNDRPRSLSPVLLHAATSQGHGNEQTGGFQGAANTVSSECWLHKCVCENSVSCRHRIYASGYMDSLVYIEMMQFSR